MRNGAWHRVGMVHDVQLVGLVRVGMRNYKRGKGRSLVWQRAKDMQCIGLYSGLVGWMHSWFLQLPLSRLQKKSTWRKSVGIKRQDSWMVSSQPYFTIFSPKQLSSLLSFFFFLAPNHMHPPNMYSFHPCYLYVCFTVFSPSVSIATILCREHITRMFAYSGQHYRWQVYKESMGYCSCVLWVVILLETWYVLENSILVGLVRCEFQS